MTEDTLTKIEQLLQEGNWKSYRKSDIEWLVKRAKVAAKYEARDKYVNEQLFEHQKFVIETLLETYAKSKGRNHK